MKRAVLYLRVSTIDQTTANQERELREVADRMGCEIVKVYKDHGISGAKGRGKRPAFDALVRDANQRKFDMVLSDLSIDWAAVCKISLASYPSCTLCASIYSCISRAWTRRHRAARPCFR